MKLLGCELHLSLSETVRGLSVGVGRISSCTTDSHGLGQDK